MSTYIVPINDYANGSVVGGGDWTNPIATSGNGLSVSGTAPNKILTLSGATTGTHIFAYTPVGSNNDVEVLVKFKLSSDVGKQGIVSLRYSGNSEASTVGYTLSGSFISSAGQLAIDEGSTGYVIWTPWNYLPNVTYWARFRINSTTLQAKVWTDGGSEPGWMINTTNGLVSSGSYSGLHQYRGANIDYTWASFGTSGDQAPNTQTTRTQTGNVRIVRTEDKTQSGNVRVTRTMDRDQLGNLRLQRQFQKFQLGNVAVLRTTDRDQLGSVMISILNDKTQVGNVRITRTMDRTQLGNVSIHKTTDRDQLGNVRVSTAYTKDQIGNLRIQRQFQKFQLGNVNIFNSTTRDQVGNVDIFRTTTRDQLGNVRISRTEDKTQLGNVRISKTNDKTQLGNVRITQTVVRDQIGRVTILRTEIRNQLGSVLISREYQRDQIGNLRITKGIDPTQKPLLYMDVVKSVSVSAEKSNKIGFGSVGTDASAKTAARISQGAKPSLTVVSPGLIGLNSK